MCKTAQLAGSRHGNAMKRTVRSLVDHALSGSRPGKKRRYAWKKFIPSEAQRDYVRALACLGVSQHYIASKMPHGAVSVDTLQRHFREELDDGREQTTMDVKRELLVDALAHGSAYNLTAKISWLKVYDPEWRAARGRGGRQTSGFVIPPGTDTFTLTFGSEREDDLEIVGSGTGKDAES